MSHKEDETKNENIETKDEPPKPKPEPDQQHRSALFPGLQSLPLGISVLMIGPEGPMPFAKDGPPATPEEVLDFLIAEEPPSFPSFPGIFDEMPAFREPGGGFRNPPYDRRAANPLIDLVNRTLNRRLSQERTARGIALPEPDIAHGREHTDRGDVPPGSRDPLSALLESLAQRLQERVQHHNPIANFLKIVEVFDHCWGCLLSQVGKNPATLNILFSLVMSKGALLANALGLSKQKFMLMADTSFNLVEAEIKSAGRPKTPEAP